MKKKRILLLAPEDYSLYRLFEKNLTSLNFDVTSLKSNEVNFSYRSFFQRLYNLYRKIRDGHKMYKQYLVKKYIGRYLSELIKNLDDFDYCIVIRADFFDIEFLECAKSKSKLMVSYHYDGLDRNPIIYRYIPLFDRFFVFDHSDVFSRDNVNTYPLHNFYFDYDLAIPSNIEYDCYFLGFYDRSREDMILRFYAFAKQHLTNVKFQIVQNPNGILRKDDYISLGIDWIEGVLPFEDYLEQISKTKIIVDFVIGEHKGLSFRIFEGLKYSRKVITTNASVKQWDFYNPSNFYVLTEDNLGSDEMREFLKSSYEPIDENIVEQYSFTSWLEKLLNVPSATEVADKG